MKVFFRAWRKSCSLTQEDVAAALGRATSTISRIESGAIDFTGKNLEQMAKLFGCHPADLFYHPDDEQMKELDATELPWNQEVMTLAIEDILTVIEEGNFATDIKVTADAIIYTYTRYIEAKLSKNDQDREKRIETAENIIRFTTLQRP